MYAGRVRASPVLVAFLSAVSENHYGQFYFPRGRESESTVLLLNTIEEWMMQWVAGMKKPGVMPAIPAVAR
jgi:hypothetical protein